MCENQTVRAEAHLCVKLADLGGLCLCVAAGFRCGHVGSSSLTGAQAPPALGV